VLCVSLQADKQAEKATKKQAKKEKLERQQQELERLSDVLRLQCLLENLGTEEIRTDLCAGKYGSMVSTVLYYLYMFHSAYSAFCISCIFFDCSVNSCIFFKKCPVFYLLTWQIIAVPFCDIVYILQERACFALFSFFYLYAVVL